MNSKNLRKTISVLCLGVICLLFSMFSGDTVSAKMNTPAYAETQNKALVQGLYNCYTKNAIVSKFSGLDKYTGPTSLLAKGMGDKKYAPLVTGYKGGAFSDSQDYLTCKYLLKPKSTRIGSIFTAYGKGNAPGKSSTVEKRSSFLTNMGYVVSSKGGGGNGNNKVCFSFKYTVKSGSKSGTGSSKTTNPVCTDGKKLSQDSGKASSGSGITLKVNKDGTKIAMSFPSGESVKNSNKYYKISAAALYKAETEKGDGDGGAGYLNKNLIQKVCGDLTCEGTNTNEHGNDRKKYYIFSDKKAAASASHASLAEQKAAWIENSSQKAALHAISWLSGKKYGSDKKSLEIGGLEKRLLYQYYATNIYKIEVQCGDNYSESAFKGKIAWFDVDSKKMLDNCYYREEDAVNKNKNKKVNGVDSNGFLKLNSINGYKAFKEEFSKLDKSYSEEEINSVVGDVIESSEESEDDGDDNVDDAQCYKQSGALGWILCPIIKGVSAAGNWMWERLSEMLSLPASEIFSTDSGVYSAWQIIRGIANTMFIILFLIVIFSQLTGVGIDNYGIKKILPKLIVAAVLINLSYIICELAVDISNILGNSLRNLLASSAASVSSGDASTAGSMAAGGLVDLALAGGGAALYSILITGGLSVIAVGVAVVGVVITIVMAIVFMYLALIIRQAGVVLLIVLAPAAIVCYMLPNTEKIYKKWLDLFKALLVVYPLCGALVGGGQLAGAILGSVDNGMMKIAGMIVQVVPFFLLPTLLRSSLSLMGNIGARMQGLTGRATGVLRGATDRTMKNSDTLQRWDNSIGMYSLSTRRRADAFNAERARQEAAYRRRRDGNTALMAERLSAARADSENRAMSEDIDRNLSFMKRNGIQLSNGQTAGFDKDGIQARLGELAAKKTLTDKEQEEVATLMHGAAQVSGGGGAMGNVIRGKTDAGAPTEAFMRAAGTAYARDGDVQNKLSNDVGASMYTEQFIAGGKYQKQQEGQQIESFEEYKQGLGDDYKGGIRQRAKSYEIGLNQSGDALNEYLGTLLQDDFQRIFDDDKLLGSIKQVDRAAFIEAAKKAGVTGKSTVQVEIKGGGNSGGGRNFGGAHGDDTSTWD